MNEDIKNKLIKMYEAGKNSCNPYMGYCAEYPGFQIDTMCFDKLNNKAVYVVFEKNATSVVEFNETIHDDDDKYNMFIVKQVKYNE